MAKLIVLPTIFACATIVLWFMLISAPEWSNTNNGSSAWEIPSKFENFTTLAEKFKLYKDDHYAYVTMLFISLYMYQQTFSIPGTFFMVSDGC